MRRRGEGAEDVLDRGGASAGLLGPSARGGGAGGLLQLRRSGRAQPEAGVAEGGDGAERGAGDGVDALRHAVRHAAGDYKPRRIHEALFRGRAQGVHSRRGRLRRGGLERGGGAGARGERQLRPDARDAGRGGEQGI